MAEREDTYTIIGHTSIEEAYQYDLEHFGKEFADETLRVARMAAAGEITDWEIVDLDVEYSRNGKSASGLPESGSSSEVVVTTSPRSPSTAPNPARP